tara:strand:+ start:172 stop:399 length:228 start_codon:yes stop_codon:yes gene_type:complete
MEKGGNIGNMKVGDLLMSRERKGAFAPIVIVLGIKEHPRAPEEDRIILQWFPRNGGQGNRGEFSRFIIEKKYKVV